MNIIFVTQAGGLKLFWQLMKSIQKKTHLEKIGFSVADLYYFQKAVKEFPEIESERYILVKEWELTGNAGRIHLDLDIIAQYEKKIGDATLWNGLVADRRIYHGKYCKYRQDYKSRFDHNHMLKILQLGLVAIDTHFNEVRPDAVVGLNAVTFADYLYYLFARHYNIPYFQLKLTRIENYVSLFTEPFKLSRHILSKYKEYYKDLQKNNAKMDDSINLAQKCYGLMREKQLTYEGSVSSIKQVEKRSPSYSPLKIFHYIKTWLTYRFSPAYHDNHFPGILIPLWHQKVLMPLRVRKTEKKIAPHYLLVDNLKTFNYAFYPMHTEPEVALSVFGRPYLNQIEIIRNIAMNLPVCWKLVVKDHPNSWGIHTADYYDKILSIPNVVLVSPQVSSKDVLKYSRLVTVVNGTIGLEAIVCQKPLITLGYSPYFVFPESMVRYVSSIHELSGAIKSLVSAYEYDENSVIAYLAAHISGSIRVNLFTDLLSKKGRTTVKHDKTIEAQYNDLTDYTLKRIKEEKNLLKNAKI